MMKVNKNNLYYILPTQRYDLTTSPPSQTMQNDFTFWLKFKVNKKIKTEKDKKLFRPQDVTLQIPNVNKFKKHTKWSPKIKFKESLKKLLEDFRSQT